MADTILGALESGAETSSTQVILKCSRILHDAGFESPAWVSWLNCVPLRLSRRKRIPANLASGGSRKPVLRSRSTISGFRVAATVGTRAGDDAVSERSTCQHPFLWTGRQGLTQDLSERSCFIGFVCPFLCLFAAVGCGRLLDAFGHHRAACATQKLGVGVSRSTGVQRRRWVPEFGRMCSCVTWTWQRSAGGGRSPSLWWCPVHHVSPLHSDGRARRGTAQQNGKALEEARHRKERTYPELVGEGGRARLIVLGAEVGGRWSKETAEFLYGSDVGRDCWLVQLRRRSQCLSDGATPSVHEVICEVRHA